jgi:hypothetical protein
MMRNLRFLFCSSYSGFFAARGARFLGGLSSELRRRNLPPHRLTAFTTSASILLDGEFQDQHPRGGLDSLLGLGGLVFPKRWRQNLSGRIVMLEGATMFLRQWRAALSLGFALAGLPAQADEPKPEAPDLPVKLGKLPDLKLAPRPPVAADLAARIKELIAGLATLDKPDFGLSSTLSGDAFAPIPGQGRATTMLLTDHGLKPSEGLKALVTLGPDALPFLLDALDDQTPTKITIEHDDWFGAMWHGAELYLNPVNPAEAVVKARQANPRPEDKHVKSYTVKVGDVCFVAVGQIVGRSYQAVRYQPTACIVLNCPAHDAKLCAEVRAIWKSEDPRAKLFDSLRADYATEGVFNGRSLDGWSSGSDFQCGAALRLLYYFAQEAAPLVAGRLDKLDLGTHPNVDVYIRRSVANGVRAEDFIKAVAWTHDAAVRAALGRVFRRTEDVDCLLAALPAVEDKDAVRGRLEPLVAALPAREDGPYGDGYQMLVALAQRTPDTARPVFERYLRRAGAQRCHTACLVLRQVKVGWDADVLAPLLNDTRTWGWTYAVTPGQNEPRRPIRVCDEAAVTLSRHHPELKFTQAGEHADLDKQIVAIRERLAPKN